MLKIEDLNLETKLTFEKGGIYASFPLYMLRVGYVLKTLNRINFLIKDELEMLIGYVKNQVYTFDESTQINVFGFLASLTKIDAFIQIYMNCKKSYQGEPGFF